MFPVRVRVYVIPRALSGPLPCWAYRHRMFSSETSMRRGHLNLLSALDALDLNDREDSNVESIPSLSNSADLKFKSKRRGNADETSIIKPSVQHDHFLFSTNRELSDNITKFDISSYKQNFSAAAAIQPTPVTAIYKGKTATGKLTRTRKEQAPPDSDLPIYSYKDYFDPKPFLVFTRDESETNDLIGGLKPGPLAFDLEWCFFYRKLGQNSKAEHRTALVQIADTAGLMLVIQIYNMPRFPKALQNLIENPKVPKMGVNILNDGKKLFRDYGVVAKNLVELGALAQIANPGGSSNRKIVSLAKLVEQYAQKVLEKGPERSSNWEADLCQKQLEYAANDVHSTLTIYNRLLDFAREGNIDFNNNTLSSCGSNVSIDSWTTSPSPLSRSPSIESSTTTMSPYSFMPSPASFELLEQRPSRKPVATSSVRPQYLRAYRYWHNNGMSLHNMCIELSLKGKGMVEGTLGESLKSGTVISYVVGALQADVTLPFDMKKLWELVQMDMTSWGRHREWILRAWSEGRGRCSEAVYSAS